MNANKNSPPFTDCRNSKVQRLVFKNATQYFNDLDRGTRLLNWIRPELRQHGPATRAHWFRIDQESFSRDGAAVQQSGDHITINYTFRITCQLWFFHDRWKGNLISHRLGTGFAGVTSAVPQRPLSVRFVPFSGLVGRSYSPLVSFSPSV